jgi:7,8-dihydropterin-6-yl-methyl-4-(beta-D-ribofuranosyl)aminobenzene 5'-phosphate synthase
MKTTHTMALAVLASAAVLTAVTETAAAAESKITILYDAFGTDAAMKKDWGFSALVEVAGKRILFDTGNDGETFAANVKAKGVDLTNLEFVILSAFQAPLRQWLGLRARPRDRS